MPPKHSIRIIPRLGIKGDNLAKGIRLEGLRVLGKRELFSRHYYERGADELMYQDVVASQCECVNIPEEAGMRWKACPGGMAS